MGETHAAVTLDLDAPGARDATVVGGKAANLARLRAGGAATPPGVVVVPGAFVDRCVVPEAAAEIRRAAAPLGPRLAVRSSATLEDTAAGAAPGLFASVVDVAPDDLLDAVVRVRESLFTEAVELYTRARGADVPRLAVIVQRFVDPRDAGVAYTRPAGRPARDRVTIESARGVAATTRDGRVVSSRGAAPDADTLAAIARAAVAAEACIDAAEGADVEWVIDGDGAVWIVQARAIVHPPEERRRDELPAALLAFSRADPHTVWRWDASHNPEPLSPAQIGLVERVVAAGLAPAPMRVVGGYLYVADAGDAADPAPALAVGQALRRRWSEELAPALDTALAPVEGDAAPALTTALTAFDALYAVYAGEVSPLVAAARRPLVDVVGDARAAQIVGRGDAHLETLLGRAAAGSLDFDALLAHAGPMAAAWDVAAPTFAERPELLRAAVSRRRPDSRPPRDDAFAHTRRARATLEGPGRARFERALDLARAARDIGEADDHYYFRAQAAVRAALLALARAWRFEDPEDIFYLPLDEVEAAAGDGHALDPDDSRARAAGARAARRRQASWIAPLAFADGEPLDTREGDGGDAGPWRGSGGGGRTEGRIARVDPDRLAPVADGAIALVATATPATCVLLGGAGGLVAEHGRALGHAAAMARELAIPYVVGCAGVWRALHDGDPVLLDGDAGIVMRR